MAGQEKHLLPHRGRRMVAGWSEGPVLTISRKSNSFTGPVKIGGKTNSAGHPGAAAALITRAFRGATVPE